MAYRITNSLLVPTTCLILIGLPRPTEARSLTAGSWVAHAVASQLARGATHADTARRQRELAGRPLPARSAKRKRRVRHRRGFVQLTGGTGLKVRRTDRAWGRKLTVDRIRQVMANYATHFPGTEPVEVHDLSRPRGGKMKPHLSHRSGRDVDIRIVLKRPTKRYVNATPRTIDRERMWFMIKQLVDSCDVEFIFLDRRLQRVLYRHARKQGVPRSDLAQIFQYPYRRLSGIVRHSKGHANHIHVRFRHSRGKFRNYAATSYCERKAQEIPPPLLF